MGFLYELGWESQHNTWEPEDNLLKVSDLVEEFESHKKYQKKGQRSRSIESVNSELEEVDQQFLMTGEADSNSLQSKNKDSTKQTYTNSQPNSKNNQSQNGSSVQKQNQNIVKNDKQKNSNSSASAKDPLDKSQRDHLSSKPTLGNFTEQGQRQSRSSPQKQRNYEQAQSSNSKHSHKYQELSPIQRQEIRKYAEEPVFVVSEQDMGKETTKKQQNNDKIQEEEGIEEEEQEFIFEAILDKRQVEGQEVEYLLKFANHDQPEWEFVSNLESIESEIKEYEEELKKKLSLTEKTKNKQQKEDVNKFKNNDVQLSSHKDFSQNSQHHQNKLTTLNENNTNQKNTLQNQNVQHKQVPEQISIDGSEELFEKDASVEKEQNDLTSSKSKQTEVNQLKNQAQDQQQSNSLSQNQAKSQCQDTQKIQLIKDNLISQLNQVNSLPNIENYLRNIGNTLPNSLNNVGNTLSNTDKFLDEMGCYYKGDQRLMTELHDTQISQLNQLKNLPNIENYLRGIGNTLPNSLNNVGNTLSNTGKFLDEMGCYYKGDQRQTIELHDTQSFSDLQKSTFKVSWKPRQNGLIPLPSYLSYQMIKKHDPLVIISLYESVVLAGNYLASSTHLPALNNGFTQ